MQRSKIDCRILVKLFVLLVVLSLQVNAKPAHAQDKITLNLHDASLETVLKEISKQTGYQYAFQDQWKEVAKKIDISVTNARLEDALDICFKEQPFTYAIIKRTIVIKEREKRSKVAENYVETHNVQGKVSNENGEPLSGATVMIKRTSRGTFTDNNGAFKLVSVPNDARIEISYSGYESREILVRSELSLNLTLSLLASSLDQVQVIGYGTTTKRMNPGDVSTVTSKEISEQPVDNALLALEGRVPGLEIVQSTGFPGSGIQISLRGTNNISGSNLPLFIVDGVPYPGQNLYANAGGGVLGSSNGGGLGNPLSYLNPADIESIDVLKDADATAIYGTLGANGVLLITTKKGKAGETKVDITVQTGIGKVPEKMKLLNTRQYLDMRYEAFRNDKTSPNPNVDYDLTLWDTTRQTDWQKVLIGGTSQFTDAEGSLSGGNSTTQFLINAGYNRQSTVIPGNWRNERGSIHYSINNSSVNHKFKVSLSGMFSIGSNLLPIADLTEDAMQMSPNAPSLYMEDGSLNWEPNLQGVSTWPNGNPASLLSGKNRASTTDFVDNFTLSYDLTKALTLKANFGYTNTQVNNLHLLPLEVRDPSTWQFNQRTSIFNNNNVHTWIAEPQLSYIRNILGGTLNALVGSTFDVSSSSSTSVMGSGFSSDQVMEDIKSATSITVLSSSQALYKYNAAFGRINYTGLNKYILDLSGRRDGSSRFGPAKQFHDFWAIGAGWILSKEKFIEEQIPGISFAKIRLSYGTTGSDDIGDYTFMDLYTPVSGGTPYQGINGILPSQIFTPDLAWQETRKIESGINIGLIHDRIMISANYYRNRSSNQLSTSSLPAIAGFTSINKNLEATVQNKGWDCEVRTTNISTNTFRWSTTFSISSNRNKLLAGSNGLNAYLQRNVGYSLFTTFRYHFLGIDPISGVDLFADKNGKPTFYPNPSNDMIYPVDYSVRYYGSIQNSIGYKGFQLECLVQFYRHPVAPGYKYNIIPGYLNTEDGPNQPIAVLDRWKNPGDVAQFERFSQNLSLLNSYQYSIYSDEIYSDASFIRLKNVSLAYSFSDKLGRVVHIQNARLFINAQNILTITKYDGLDPETASSTTVPPLRTITFGFQLTL